VRAFGLDPGKSAAWLVLDLASPGARARLLGCGTLDRGIAEGRDDRPEEAIDLFARFEVDVVGVETVDFVAGREGFGPHMAGHLVRAGRIGAKVYQAAKDYGYRAHEYEAEAWRRWLVGSAQSGNPAILATMKVRLIGFPADATDHEADAGGVALFTAERALLEARGVPLPPGRRAMNAAPKRRRR
jgi:Holliday junction resolvasome RuvABC endonuclease subunit